MFTRRTATVIISAPDASCACTITAGDEYLPVPTISREVNVLSAIRKLSTYALSPLPSALVDRRLAASNEVHDLDGVALVDRRLVEQVALEHRQVVLDRDPA